MANFFLLYYFSPRFLYFAFLHIHRWLNMANITPHGPYDGSVEPKLYIVGFLIRYLLPHAHTHTHTHIYIYIVNHKSEYTPHISADI